VAALRGVPQEEKGHVQLRATLAALRHRGAGLPDGGPQARWVLRCALGIAEGGAPGHRLDVHPRSPKLAAVASAAASLLAAAVGASAGARREVIARHVDHQLLRRVLGGLRRATMERSPRVRALAAEARAAQLRVLHADAAVARSALAGHADAQAAVPGGSAAVARARMLWRRARRSWPAEEATAEEVGSLRQQWRWRQLLLRWWQRSERSSAAALVEEVLDQDAQTPEERVAVAARPGERARRADKLHAAARRSAAMAAAAQPPAPRKRRGGAARAGGTAGAGQSRAAAPEGGKRPAARAGREERRAAKEARRAAEARAVERAERLEPPQEPGFLWGIMALASVARPAWSAAAVDEDMLVVLPPVTAAAAEGQRRAAPLRGRDIRGSRGVAASNAARDESTLSSTGQRVVPPSRVSWASVLGR
jgi:hypothetical protein